MTVPCPTPHERIKTLEAQVVDLTSRLESMGAQVAMLILTRKGSEGVQNQTQANQAGQMMPFIHRSKLGQPLGYVDPRDPLRSMAVGQKLLGATMTDTAFVPNSIREELAAMSLKP